MGWKQTGAALLALGLVLTLVAPVSAKAGMRPFKGTAAGELFFEPVGFDVCPAAGTFLGGLSTNGLATGTASHLGRVTMTSRHCTPAGDDILGGMGSFVAANGDEITFLYEGTAPFPGPGTVTVVADTTFEIVGGTGRFADAHGDGSLTAVIPFGGIGVPVWPGAVWTWEGEIAY